ncbi:MAG: hypothetical protein ACJA01_003135, partial [Saprospiraceae bacterium]
CPIFSQKLHWVFCTQTSFLVGYLICFELQ